MNMETLLRERVNYISECLKEKFNDVWYEDKHWFILPNGEAIRIVGLGGDLKALVIEFADNTEEISRIRAEDVGFFPLEEYTPEQMFDAIMKEIENELQTPSA